MWHRGDRITGRDIFDFAVIAEREPKELMPAAEWMARLATGIFQQLNERYEPLNKQFYAVDVLNFHPTFDQACGPLKATQTAMLEDPSLRKGDSPDVNDEPHDGAAAPGM